MQLYLDARDFARSLSGQRSFRDPVCLCMFRPDIYCRANSAHSCSINGCVSVAPIPPPGAYACCAFHGTSTEAGGQKALPKAQFYRIKQDANSTPTARKSRRRDFLTEWLTLMSPSLMRQAVQEALDLGRGGGAELEATKHIALNYGGRLVGNAALVEQHWPTGHGCNALPNPTATADPTPYSISPPPTVLTIQPLPTPPPPTDKPVLNYTLPNPISSSTGPPAVPPLVAGGSGPSTFAPHPTPTLPEVSPGPPPAHASVNPTGSIQPATHPQAIPTLLAGVATPKPPISAPVSAVSDPSFQNEVRRHLGNIDNPESVTKSGTLEGAKRPEEIWAYVARGFDTFSVALRHGIVGNRMLFIPKP